MNYKLLKREGTDEAKQALLERLRRDEPPPTLMERMGMWWERLWPQARVPTYATSFAVALAAATSFAVFYTQGPIAAPEIEEMEFDGGQAVVFESTTDPATLIWLEDDADVEEEGEEF